MLNRDTAGVFPKFFHCFPLNLILRTINVSAWICGDDEKNTYYCWPYPNKVSLKFPFTTISSFCHLTFYFDIAKLRNCCIQDMLSNCLYFVHLSSNTFCMKERKWKRELSKYLFNHMLRLAMATGAAVLACY